MIDVFEMVDISLSDKGKSDILQKFGEYTPDSIKKYFMDEKGATESEAQTAATIIEKAAASESKLKKAFPFISISIIAIILLIRFGKK